MVSDYKGSSEIVKTKELCIPDKDWEAREFLLQAFSYWFLSYAPDKVRGNRKCFYGPNKEWGL